MNTKLKLLCLFAFGLVVTSCNQKPKNQESKMERTTYDKGSFGYDADFLKQRDTSLIILKNGESQIIVSPKYQAKVFTSTSQGEKGNSYGWINYDVFDKPEDAHMNAYGGENRFWLGPEGSKFSLFFKPGTKMVFENWHTPAPVDTESWEVTSKNDDKVSMEKSMSLLNYSNTHLHIKVKRSVKLLTSAQIENKLNIQLDSVSSVGFTTENSITNTGREKWSKETGAPVIWMLDMFTPSPKTVIVIPYNEDVEGKVATTDYFGEISKDRIKYNNGKIFFKADGKSRGKLGVPPKRAKNRNGSYDPINHILTITSFEVDTEATYLNQEWTPEKDPLVGDAVNAYNDGPLEDGSQMGPFYEIESVSPAAFLAPNDSLSHTHSVFHFSGNEGQLNKISQQLLGTDINEIQQAFN